MTDLVWFATKGIISKLGALVATFLGKYIRKKLYPFHKEDVEIKFFNSPRIVMSWKNNRSYFSEQINIINRTYYTVLVLSLKFDVRTSGSGIFNLAVPVSKQIEVGKEASFNLESSLTFFEANRITEHWNMQKTTKSEYNNSRQLTYIITASLLVDGTVYEIEGRADTNTTLAYEPNDM